MMIPMRDAPTFTHPEQWSKEFRDFVAMCLIKQPEKRKTAEEMLKVRKFSLSTIKLSTYFKMTLFSILLLSM